MKKFLIGVLALGTPFLAGATVLGTTFTSIVQDARNILNILLPVLMMVAVVVFLWGVVKYITSSGDEEKRKEAKGYIIYGLIGIFVMVALWGIVTVVASTLGLGTPGAGISLPPVTAP